MKKSRTRWGAGGAAILAAGALLITASPAAASSTSTSGQTPAACGVSPQQVKQSAAAVHVSGIMFAQNGSTTGLCHKPPAEPPFNGTPPLLFNGSPSHCTYQPCANGDMMMTASTGPLTVVPIFWVPRGYSMSTAYENIIVSYIRDVAADSGHTANVFSVLNEYSGNNGQIQYDVKLGPVITDTDRLTSGCTLAKTDRTEIYSDGSGYSSCVDDAQLQGEVDSVTAANRLPHDLAHIYVLYLPKGVESCLLPGETTTVGPNGQFCTINHQQTAAYCAYHGDDTNSAVYANLAYPIYQSPVGYTCSSDARFPAVQSPNGNPDADTEVSPTSHEISEAITDPDTETGWFDSSGNEIGDDCAYIYGRTRGAPGAYFNQVINGQDYLTQEEFSNNLFASSGGQAGCLQSEG
jgi:hypothetical protein